MPELEEIEWEDIGDDLTEEDEIALDKAWAFLAEHKKNRTPEQQKHAEEWQKELERGFQPDDELW